METETPTGLGKRLRTLVIGTARSPHDHAVFHKLTLIAFFAWVGLGADGLSSSCYGPEEAFLALGEHRALGIFVALASVVTVLVLSASYSQIIEIFPSGGGGYVVASLLLSPKAGMVSGCALLVDYILTITISIASGADALFSFLPAEWQPYKLTIAYLGVAGLIVLNLRGAKESIIPLVPIFLVFVVTHAFVILYAVATHLPDVSRVVHETSADVRSLRTQVGMLGIIVIILKAYSMGAGTYTGIEAVSNGLAVLREPKVQTARRTMRYMAVSLAVTVFGLMLGYLLFDVRHEHGKTLNAVLFDRLTAAWPAGLGSAFVKVTLVSEAALLFIAAQAGFLDGPRVLANMAIDRWAPTRFAMLSDRFVTQNGVLLMGVTAMLMMFLTGGSVKFLVVLYSINVFITFVLSQAGMVRHWWTARREVADWVRRIIVNGIGLAMTAFILCTVLVLKFHDGGWITLLVTGAIVALSLSIRRHYQHTTELLRRLDTLVRGAEVGHAVPAGAQAPALDPDAKTAVLLVNGFNGLGLHTLMNIFKLFGKTYRNFVFVQVGQVDVAVFKDAEEIQRLQRQVRGELDRYIAFMNRQGYFAEGISSIGTDVPEEVAKLMPDVLERFPGAVLFGGQLVFPQDTFLSRWLHNYTIFSLQRRFYHQGIPLVILPIRV